MEKGNPSIQSVGLQINTDIIEYHMVVPQNIKMKPTYNLAITLLDTAKRNETTTWKR